MCYFEFKKAWLYIKWNKYMYMTIIMDIYTVDKDTYTFYEIESILSFGYQTRFRKFIKLI